MRMTSKRGLTSICFAMQHFYDYHPAFQSSVFM